MKKHDENLNNMDDLDDFELLPNYDFESGIRGYFYRQPEFQSPAWHGEVIKERLSHLAEGKDEMIPFEQIKLNLKL